MEPEFPAGPGQDPTRSAGNQDNDQAQVVELADSGAGEPENAGPKPPALVYAETFAAVCRWIELALEMTGWWLVVAMGLFMSAAIAGFALPPLVSSQYHFSHELKVMNDLASPLLSQGVGVTAFYIACFIFTPVLVAALAIPFIILANFGGLTAVIIRHRSQQDQGEPFNWRPWAMTGGVIAFLVLVYLAMMVLHDPFGIVHFVGSVFQLAGALSAAVASAWSQIPWDQINWAQLRGQLLQHFSSRYTMVAGTFFAAYSQFVLQPIPDLLHSAGGSMLSLAAALLLLLLVAGLLFHVAWTAWRLVRWGIQLLDRGSREEVGTGAV